MRHIDPTAHVRRHDRASEIDAALADPSLDEFWRQAGRLRPALSEVAEALRSDLVVYAPNVAAPLRVLEGIACGFKLDAVLETQGKTPMLDGIRDVLERCRAASKPDLAELLPTLVLMANDLAAVDGNDAVLRGNLAVHADSLAEVVAELDEAKASAASPKKRSRAGTATDAASSVGSKAPSSRRSSKRSSKRGSTSGSKGWEGPAGMDPATMLRIRTAQRALAMLVNACDLPDHLKVSFAAPPFSSLPLTHPSHRPS